MSMAMTTSLPKHTSATLNRFLGKVNGYEPGLINLIFDLMFVPSKGGERSNRFIKYIYDKNRPFTCSSRIREYINKNSIRQAEIIMIYNKNCNIPEFFASNSKDQLKNIVNSDYILRIPRWAFNRCSNLKTFKFNDNIEKLGRYAFSGCKNLEIDMLPSKLKSIGNGCFSRALKNKHLTLPNNLKIMGYRAFSGCGLESITLPSNLKSISSECFYECYNLKSIKLPNTLESIENFAFFRSGLESIIIPSSVTNLERAAFWHCKNMKTASLPIHLKPIIDASSPRNFTSIFNKKVKITYRYPFKIKEKRT